jgi:predicted GIY-YIG superfamily endonuclease
MSTNFCSQENFPSCQSQLTRLDALRKGRIPEDFQGEKTVYLLHFAKPFGTEKQSISHYLGITDNLPRRLRQHRKGNRQHCVITHELKKHHIAFCCVQTWEHVNQDFEQYLKSWKNHKLFCPDCQDVPFF